VVAAAAGSTASSRAALAELIDQYWYPLYAYLRRQGESAADAQDLVQAFFAELLEKEFLRSADEQRGRFRSFLLVALKRFRSKEYAKERAQKRGGDAKHVALDFESGERRYQLEPADSETPEDVYQRRWALTVLESALAELRAGAESAGETARFQQLKIHLVGEGGESYAATAEKLGISSNAVKAAVFRLRSRFREAVRDQIAATVSRPDQIEDEMQELQRALRPT
jgi:RNA polymerase sigma-70 factor (ECF subfamily)